MGEQKRDRDYPGRPPTTKWAKAEQKPDAGPDVNLGQANADVREAERVLAEKRAVRRELTVEPILRLLRTVPGAHALVLENVNRDPHSEPVLRPWTITDKAGREIVSFEEERHGDLHEQLTDATAYLDPSDAEFDKDTEDWNLYLDADG